MAPELQGIVRQILTNALQSDGLANALQGGGESSNGGGSGSSNGSGDGKGSTGGGGRSVMKGLAAGAGAAALAPIALKTAEKLARSLGVDNLEDLVTSPGKALEGARSGAGDTQASNDEDETDDAGDEAGGPGGTLKDAAQQMLPFGGGGGGSKGGVQGVGKGRRMPVQQSVDIGLPVETVYNQFTQFEEWPTFMHRVTSVSQEDDCTVSFSTKIWTRKREFKASIETQRPDERIKWKVSEGLNHTGVISFHELGPNLTRVILSFDVQPGGLIEKIARGARHIKRAARADLHRFCALIEMAEHETGAWRGVIEDGELVEEHDPSYDEQREYSDIEDLTGQDDEDESEEDDEDESEDEDQSDESDEDQSDEDQDEESEDDEAAEESSQRQTRSGRGSGRGRSSQGGSSRSRSSQGGSSRSRSSQGGSSRSGSSQGGSSRRASSSGRSRSSSSNGSSGGSSGRSRSQQRSR